MNDFCIICGDPFTRIRKHQILCGKKSCKYERKKLLRKARLDKAKNIAQKQTTHRRDCFKAKCVVCGKPFEKKAASQILCGSITCAKARQEELKIKNLEKIKKQNISEPEPEPRPKHEVKMRICLKCQKEFKSEWNGNRICPTCKNGKAFKSGITEYNVHI